MNKKEILHLSTEFEDALNILEKTNTNLFVTGKAGTGKSTLLRLFKNTTRKKSIFLAPTGIAALNIQGQTIHSFFGFPPKLISKNDIKPRRNRKIYEAIEVLVIDEISMVRADLLDNIDYFLRLNRGKMDEPFGGVQIIFFGDMFQLPPVLSNVDEKTYLQRHYKSIYFFSSDVFMTFQIKIFELNKIYRQDERHFIRLLESVRMNKVDEDDLADLNERYIADFISQQDEHYITLSPRNAQVDMINSSKLSHIKSKEFIYEANVTGDFTPNLFPTEAKLRLKKDAQVMFIKNDVYRKYVNGTIGKIHSLSDDYIKVSIEEKGETRLVEVERQLWEMQEYELDASDKHNITSKTIGTFEQFPLRLAWAITIHKSQGKTFDKVIIDMGKGAFENGQTYVALSRCRSINGIVLAQPLRQEDIMTDQLIIDFYEQNVR